MVVYEMVSALVKYMANWYEIVDILEIM